MFLHFLPFVFGPLSVYCSSEEGGGARLLRFTPDVISSVLKSCWTSSDFLVMFTSEKCRLAYKYMLDTSPLLHVDTVEDPPFTKAHMNGAFRVELLRDENFPDGLYAQFKSCNHNHETYKSEVIVHAIDRLLRIHRVPVTVMRQLKVGNVLSVASGERVVHNGKGKHEHGKLLMVTTRSNEHVVDRLVTIARACNNGRVFVGSMEGWVKYPLVTLHQFAITYLPNVECVPTPQGLSQVCREVSRLLFSLVVEGHLLKMSHNIVLLKDKHAQERLVLVSIDNDRALWKTGRRNSGDAPMRSSAQVCNRHSRSGGVSSRTSLLFNRRRSSLVFAPTSRRDRIHRKAVLASSPLLVRSASSLAFSCQFPSGKKPPLSEAIAYLRQACVFPKEIVERMRHYETSSLSLPKAVELFVRETTPFPLSEGDDPFRGNTTWDAKRLQGFFEETIAALSDCLKLYPRENVIFDNIDSVDDPNMVAGEVRSDVAETNIVATSNFKVHIDPHGQHFQFDDDCGCWKRFRNGEAVLIT